MQSYDKDPNFLDISQNNQHFNESPFLKKKAQIKASFNKYLIHTFKVESTNTLIPKTN